MDDQRFKTLRHIEAVRNHLHLCIRELMEREERHDQSKMQNPERAAFDEFTPKLRDLEYGSEQYRETLRQMKPAIEHHNASNRHHPEHFIRGIDGMNLIDVLEMICDWRAAAMRHNTGDAHKSLEINAERFKLSPQLVEIIRNTINWMDQHHVFHYASES